MEVLILSAGMFGTVRVVNDSPDSAAILSKRSWLFLMRIAVFMLLQMLHQGRLQYFDLVLPSETITPEEQEKEEMYFSFKGLSRAERCLSNG